MWICSSLLFLGPSLWLVDSLPSGFNLIGVSFDSLMCVEMFYFVGFGPVLCVNCGVVVLT